MINNDWPADSWNKPVDSSEIRRIIKEEVKAEGKRIVENLVEAISTKLMVEAIPIEFIKKYYEDITMPHTDTRIQFEELIRKWEKENDSK